MLSLVATSRANKQRPSKKAKEEGGEVRKLKAFMRDNIVLAVACAAALVTCCIVTPDQAYLDYLDVKTIACLFSILAVVGAMRNLGMFQYAARKIIHRFSTCRACVCALVGVTLVISMVATNDMALIMMLPLSAATLLAAGWGKALPFAFVMQNLAANLGGMILPFGNPQNLYLFECFQIELPEFLGVMAVPFGLSVAMIAICCLSSEEDALGPASLPEEANFRIRSKREATPHEPPVTGQRAKRRIRAVVYAALMLLVILSVFRLIPYIVSTAVVVAVLAVMDRRAIQTLDYGLLLTFVFFFVFAGNMSRIPAVDQLLSTLMTQWPLAVSAGLSQIISNVPAAVLLSHFTDAWQALLVGVNIGGAGTIVGSLASLITLQHYRAVRRESAPQGDPSASAPAPAPAPALLPSTPRFIAEMTVYNVTFLLVLFALCGILWPSIEAIGAIAAKASAAAAAVA